MLDSLLDFYEAAMTPPGLFISLAAQVVIATLCVLIARGRRIRMARVNAESDLS